MSGTTSVKVTMLDDVRRRVHPCCAVQRGWKVKRTAEVRRVPAVAVYGAHVHPAGAGSPHIRRLSLANHMFTHVQAELGAKGDSKRTLYPANDQLLQGATGQRLACTKTVADVGMTMASWVSRLCSA